MKEPAITEASIRKMVDSFYAKVRQDAILAPVFEERLAQKWDRHMPRMYAFWTKVLLGQGEFQGNVFSKHMALDGIEKEHFVRWLGLFSQTVHALHEEEDARTILAVAERIATSLQLGYFGEKTV